jgi:hypothetical protein
VLDAGCGVGVLGICAARALAATRTAAVGPAWEGIRVRAQDRDELARVFTLHNAAQNGIPDSILGAHTEPLLACSPASPWDLILSNIPAKTGEPVLLDFIARSAGLLSEGGQVMLVVVNTLADLLRDRIAELGLPLLRDETGKEHTVLAYGKSEKVPVTMGGGDGEDGFLQRWPYYLRQSADFRLEDTGYHIDAFHGVAGFDNPGGAVTTMARLAAHMGPTLGDRCAAKPLLVHEPDQGHFPAWLLNHLGAAHAPAQTILSGRNILALEAARHNLGGAAKIVPAVDILLSRDELLAAAGTAYGAAFIFPDPVPQTSRVNACWEGLEALLETGGIALIALPSSEAERFDRAKPRSFTRLGDHKRHGFRALAYERR